MNLSDNIIICIMRKPKQKRKRAYDPDNPFAEILNFTKEDLNALKQGYLSDRLENVIVERYRYGWLHNFIIFVFIIFLNGFVVAFSYIENANLDIATIVFLILVCFILLLVPIRMRHQNEELQFSVDHGKIHAIQGDVNYLYNQMRTTTYKVDIPIDVSRTFRQVKPYRMYLLEHNKKLLVIAVEPLFDIHQPTEPSAIEQSVSKFFSTLVDVPSMVEPMNEQDTPIEKQKHKQDVS
ncbi:MAG: hypothetical protein AAFR81_08640 [Chloroflexota bacterium]